MQVALDLLNSTEHRIDTVNFVFGYFLQRAPDPAGLSTQVAYLASGATDEQLIAQIAGSSAEYYSIATAG
jgi:hypothetical protein